MPEIKQKDYQTADLRFYTVSERQAMEAKKELPKVRTFEKVCNHVYLWSSVGCVLACVVLILVFLLAFPSSKFYADGSYGILGLVAMFLVAISSLLALFTNVHYHLKDVEKEDHKKEAIRKNILQYVAIIALFAGFGFIWVRPDVTSKITWAYLGYFMMGLVWVLCALGIFFNVKYTGKNDRLVKVYNEAMILGVLWIPVCFYALLANSHGGTTAACILAVFAPIVMDIAYIFYKSSKKTAGMYTLWHIVSFGSYMMECVAIFYYAMFIAKTVASM